MAADRRTALAQEAAADQDLATHLATVDLPSVQTGGLGLSYGSGAPPPILLVRGFVPRLRSSRVRAWSSVSGSSVLSHCRAFQNTSGAKAKVAASQSTAEAIC